MTRAEVLETFNYYLNHLRNCAVPAEQLHLLAAILTTATE